MTGPASKNNNCSRYTSVHELRSRTDFFLKVCELGWLSKHKNTGQEMGVLSAESSETDWLLSPSCGPSKRDQCGEKRSYNIPDRYDSVIMIT